MFAKSSTLKRIFMLLVLLNTRERMIHENVWKNGTCIVKTTLGLQTELESPAESQLFLGRSVSDMDAESLATLCFL